MASLTITIPDALVSRVSSGLTVRYSSIRRGGDTDAQFVQKVIAELIRREVILAEESVAFSETDGPARSARISQRKTDLGGIS